MLLLQYYELKPCSDISVTGTYEQINVPMSLKYYKQPNTYKILEYKSFPKNTPDLSYFPLKPGTKLTDIMSAFAPPISKGIFTGKRFYNLVKQHKMTNGKWYPASFIFEKRKIIENYQFLHLIDKPSHIINFQKSVFADFSENEKEVKLNPEDYDDLPDMVEPKIIVLNQTIDIFRSPYDVKILISEKLKEKMEQEKLTGFETHKYEPCEFLVFGQK